MPVKFLLMLFISGKRSQVIAHVASVYLIAAFALPSAMILNFQHTTIKVKIMKVVESF
jgi:hypothetical protein